MSSSSRFGPERTTSRYISSNVQFEVIRVASAAMTILWAFGVDCHNSGSLPLVSIFAPYVHFVRHRPIDPNNPPSPSLDCFVLIGRKSPTYSEMSNFLGEHTHTPPITDISSFVRVSHDLVGHMHICPFCYLMRLFEVPCTICVVSGAFAQNVRILRVCLTYRN